MYDTRGDDGGVVPVAAAAVVLSRVVTLPRLARDASSKIKHKLRAGTPAQIQVKLCMHN